MQHSQVPFDLCLQTLGYDMFLPMLFGQSATDLFFCSASCSQSAHGRFFFNASYWRVYLGIDIVRAVESVVLKKDLDAENEAWLVCGSEYDCMEVIYSFRPFICMTIHCHILQ